MPLPSLSRRGFLATTAAAAAPAWLLEESRSHAQPAAPQSSNDKPHIALIGCGAQGRGDTRTAANFGPVVAVCDVDDRHAAQAAEMFKGATIYKDFRKLLDRNDIHVVVN